MNQTINILRKDARQLLFPLLALLAILVLITAIEPRTWTQRDTFLPIIGQQSGVLEVLFAINWAILIIRLVQAERLIGLNQFWTTRPYEWQKLMAAKALFLLLFLYTPLLLAQIFLLRDAGLPILQNTPLILGDLFLLTALSVLPIACFASFTASIPQAIMALLGSYVVFVILFSFDAPRFKDLAPGMLIPVQIVIFAAVLTVALFHQYYRRKTLQSVAIFVFAPVLVLLLQATIPGTSLAARSYVLLTGASPISIQFDKSPVRKFGTTLSDNPKATLLLHVPLLASTIPHGTSFHSEGEKLTLTGANGYTWQSMWLAKQEVFAPGAIASQQTETYTEFYLPQDVYNHLASGTVSIRIDFALAQFQDQPPFQSTLSTSGSVVPGVGVCALDTGYTAIHCRSAFRKPAYFTVDTVRQIGPCIGSPMSLEPAQARVGDTGDFALSAPVSPVVVTNLQLGPSARATLHQSANLCPGLPITFTRKVMQEHLRVEMPDTQIVLKDYMNSIYVH